MGKYWKRRDKQEGIERMGIYGKGWEEQGERCKGSGRDEKNLR